jgi:acetolactate synthase-1/2/3 large subunit
VDNHYQPVLELRGDVASTVEGLTQLVAGLELSEEFARAVDVQRQALADIDQVAVRGAHGPLGLNPAALVLEWRATLDDDATVAVDMGTNYIHMARHFRTYHPRHLLFTKGQQTLGVALPWAIAATLVRPGKQVVSVSGDGGFLYSAMELETAVRLGSTFTHVIMRDNTYDMVGFQQLLKFGRKSGVALGDYDIVHYAKAFGASGYRVTTPDEFDLAMCKALAEDGPSIVDVAVDYSRSVDIGAQLHDDVLD